MRGEPGGECHPLFSARCPGHVLVTREHAAAGDYGVLEVRDQGPGVSPETLPRIFERFAAGASSQGLGPGLYLAKSIASAHDGDLNVTSMPSRGTRFVLKVPTFA